MSDDDDAVMKRLMKNPYKAAVVQPFLLVNGLEFLSWFARITLFIEKIIFTVKVSWIRVSFLCVEVDLVLVTVILDDGFVIDLCFSHLHLPCQESNPVRRSLTQVDMDQSSESKSIHESFLRKYSTKLITTSSVRAKVFQACFWLAAATLY